MRERKRKGVTPTGGRSSSFMVSCTSSCWDKKQVEWCCSCTRHSTYFTKGSSEQANKFLQHRPHLQRLLLMVQFPEQGLSAAIPDYIKGPPGTLSTRRRPDRLIPTRIGFNIFFLAVDIGGQDWGKGVPGRGAAPIATGTRWGGGGGGGTGARVAK